MSGVAAPLRLLLTALCTASVPILAALIVADRRHDTEVAGQVKYKGITARERRLTRDRASIAGGPVLS
jgi:hypothetical protein